MNGIQKYQNTLKNAPHKTFPQDGRPIFYVCSYGGSGSTMLTRFLSQYGTAYHIHSLIPPQYLTYPINAKFIDNFSTVKVPENELKRCKVIYIFRNPTSAQISVYCDYHRVHLEYPNPGDKSLFPVKLQEYVARGKNTLNYGRHYNNYMCHANRNYEIIGVNYHKLWDDSILTRLCKKLELPDSAAVKFPPKKEKPHQPQSELVPGLNKMNAGLIGIINNAPALQFMK